MEEKEECKRWMMQWGKKSSVYDKEWKKKKRKKWSYRREEENKESGL